MSDLHYFFAGVLTFVATLFPVHNMVYVASAVASAPQATILVGGDIMMDRSIRIATNEKGGDFIFSCIDDTLRQADLVLVNLEGPITANPSKSIGSSVGSPANFTFTFPTSTATLLAAHNIKVVNLGNNHIENFATAGERSTMQYLRAAGVDYFGDTIDQTVAHRSIKGIPFAFINFNQFAQSSTDAATIAQIKAAREAGEMPIVYTHWGIEYQTTSSAYSRELAHSFIDAGAEIVIGSHPHVIEESELYKGKYIYYSLGNFVFDQYWNEAVRTGLLLSITFNEKGVVAVREIKTHLERDRRTCLLAPSL